MPLVPRSVGDAADDARELMRRGKKLVGDVLEAALKSWRESEKPTGQVAQSEVPGRGEEQCA